jgi:peptidoglycan/LPS O-acetylase OafA/YrhL
MVDRDYFRPGDRIVMLRYRPDIDGLRAIAVIAVVMYHFAVPGFTGGYVGVDVFFVISGFLIVSLIQREIEERRFSLLNFYERRVRRIFPALVVLLLAVSVLAYRQFFPGTYREFGKSISAASVFLSNVEFWREGGRYFAAPAREQPLLHTWSLAIEEQFYLLFPPLLILLARFQRRIGTAVLLSLTVLSLGFSIVTASVAPQTAFYLFPARFWELLFGALVAIGGLKPLPTSIASNSVCALGLAMIVASVALYGPTTVFPGIAALLPCAGTALVLYGGLDDRTQPSIYRVLSMRPLVFIGLISYSLYLWHWPIFVFSTYNLERDLVVQETIGLIALSFAIAAVSWRFVEKPFRRLGGVASRRFIFAQAAAATVLFAVSGIAIYATNGVPQRFAPDVQALLAPKTENRSALCNSGQAEQTDVGPLCRIGRPNGPITFIIWGDSHGRAISPAIDRAANRLGYSGWIGTLAGCPPFIGSPNHDNCAEHNGEMLKFLQRANIDTVFLVAHWTAYAERSYYDNGKLIMLDPIKDDASRELALEEDHRVFARSIRTTANTLRANGKRVVIVGQVPEIRVDVPTTLAKSRMHGLPEDLGPTLAEFKARNKTVLDTLTSLEGEVELVFPHEALCAGPRCEVVRDGHPLYIDGTHLHRFGAELLSSIFEPVFAAQLKRPKE